MNPIAQTDKPGKRPDFEAMVHEYTDYVYHIAYRILGSTEDARDTVQETFIKAHRSFHLFDSSRDPKNWLCTIALNASRDHYRARKRSGTRVPVLEEVLPDRENAAQGLENKLEAEKLLLLLPLEFRTVMLLFYLEEKSHREIAQVLGIPVVLVKVRLFRARKLIVKLMAGRKNG
jgi:RNA polymerase sigma-70 factor, ECF subfamily